jgi:hypothetical protein
MFMTRAKACMNMLWCWPRAGASNACRAETHTLLLFIIYSAPMKFMTKLANGLYQKPIFAQLSVRI